MCLAAPSASSPTVATLTKAGRWSKLLSPCSVRIRPEGPLVAARVEESHAEDPERFKHDEAFYGERRKSQKAGQRHFKNLPSLKNGEDVEPSGRRPVIPELPENSANEAGEHEIPEDR